MSGCALNTQAHESRLLFGRACSSVSLLRHGGAHADDELYACDAQWSGLFDRMLVHLPEETERRVELAAAYGE